MNKEELIEFLKENLKVEVVTDREGSNTYIEVKLYLNGDLLSSDSGSVYTG